MSKNIIKILVLLFCVSIFLITDNLYARERKEKHEFYLTGWRNELSGSVNLSNQGYSFSSDFKGDGNFDKETTVGIGWLYNIGKLSDVYVNYHKIENNGRIRAVGTGVVQFNGVNYTLVGGVATVDLNLKVDVFDILGGREIAKGENGFVDFIYGLKIMKYSFEAIDALNTRNRASYSITVPVPNFGIRTLYNLDKNLKFYAVLSGFSLNRNDKGGKLRNIDLGIEYKFYTQETKNVDWSIMLGYKDEYLDGKDKDNKFVIEHKGPQFKIIGRF